MAGHSKWAQIKRAKAVTDAARSRVFSRMAREITLESKKASGNVSSPGLAAVITRAKAANMPKDNIDRAVAKGTSKDAGELEQVAYEFYGPGGIAIIATAVTDSKNRTTQEVKHLLSKNGYELGAPGSASWAFTKSPDGRYTANEPKMPISGDDEVKLGEILNILDEQETCKKRSRTQKAMRVLAIDPGYDRMGIAVVEGDPSKPKLVWSDCITPPKGEHQERLAAIRIATEEALNKYQPDLLAIEKLFFSNNKTSAMGVAEARGAVLAAIGRTGIPVKELAPGTVKLAVTGNGAADKKAVAHMVALQIALPEKKRLDDEVDAIAIGIAALAERFPH